MKILAITQARIGSTRLPEKILKKIDNETLLGIHLKRILKSKLISKLKVATTTETGTDQIVGIAAKLGIESYKGSINNVLDRFYQTALTERPDWIVRLTSDCPLIDPVEIDRVIEFALMNDLDYGSNTLDPTFPDGLDAEVFRFSALEKAVNEAKLISELEHVTPYIWKNSTYKGGSIFTSDNMKNDTDYSSIRLTVDTAEDFLVIEKLIHILGTDMPWMDYVTALENNPQIAEINSKYQRNEGYAKSVSNENK
jgi:spore coat polysaccharide biosynthesis protein SpsF